jgi:hypothetical protein
MKRHWIWYALKATVFILLAFSLFGWLIKTVWNAVVPSVFSGPSVTFKEALGIFILGKLLIWVVKRVWTGKTEERNYWRRKMEKHLSAMTPEEREKFKQAYARRCGHWSKLNEEEIKEEKTFEKETVSP